MYRPFSESGESIMLVQSIAKLADDFSFDDEESGTDTENWETVFTCDVEESSIATETAIDEPYDGFVWATVDFLELELPDQIDFYFDLIAYETSDVAIQYEAQRTQELFGTLSQTMNQNTSYPDNFDAYHMAHSEEARMVYASNQDHFFWHL